MSDKYDGIASIPKSIQYSMGAQSREN